MSCARRLAIIGIVTGVGMAQVATRNALWLKSYALGERVEQTHQAETDVAWLQARVLHLTSPDHLSDTAQTRHLNLVAWSTLSPEQVHVLADSVDTEADTVQVADGRDTSD